MMAISILLITRSLEFGQHARVGFTLKCYIKRARAAIEIKVKRATVLATE